MTATVGPRKLRAMSGGIDQVFSSVANGLIVFAVAVAASPDAFGHITILMTLLIAVLACLRGGLGVLLLQTANQSTDDIRRGGSLALATALAVSPVLAVAMLSFAPLIGFAAIALAFSAPFVLGQDVLRYVAMTIGRPHVAALWDGVWCLGAFAALVCAWLRLPFVSAGTVLTAWGVLALIAFVAMAINLRVLPTTRGLGPWLKADWHHRVRYGVEAGLEQVGLLLIFIVVTGMLSADATGTLRGVMALFAPIGIIGAAVQIILIPESVRAAASPRQVWRVLRFLAFWTAAATAAVGVVVYFLPPSVGFYLLGESFEPAQQITIPATAWFVAACLSVMQGLFLRTFNRSSQVLTMKVTLTVLQLVATIIAAVWFKSAGAVAAALAVQTFLAAVFFLFLWRPWRMQADAPADPVVADLGVPVLAVDGSADEAPLPLSVTALRDGVTGPGRPWRRVDIVAETGSTNADLLARARAGENVDGVVLIAEHQSAGRGRLGRNWVDTPRAQIALSVGVDASAVPTDRWGLLPLATGVAVIDAITDETGVQARLKWPNDVLAGDAKLAGILAEVASPAPVIVVGVGLNVTLSPQEASQPNATSLLELGVADPDRDRLAARMLLELGARIADWRAGAGAHARLAADYHDRSATIGAQVRVVLPGGQEVVGTAKSVDDQGRLVIDSDGDARAVSSGDVVHLRPA